MTWYYDDATGRIGNRTVVHTPTGNVLQNLSYTYDNNGNVKTIVDNTSDGTAGRTFDYDDLNRLTLASGTFGPLVNNLPSFVNGEVYQYDAIGNITRKGGVTYAYSNLSHPSAVTDRSDGKHYDYDNSGNMTFSAGRTLIWNADNQMSSADGMTYVYDYTGRRVKKITAGGQITRYPFPGYEVQPDGVVMKYVDVAAKKSTGQRLFYHNDHLGGVHVITDMTTTQTTGQRAQLVEYDAWGSVSRSEGNIDATQRFTGQKLDAETGLMYYGGRYYDPVLGRFASADPIVTRAANPQGLNRYSYALNNPARFTDPSGYSAKKVLGWVGLFFGDGLWMLSPNTARQTMPIVAGVAVGVVVTASTYGTCAPCGVIAGGATAGALSGGLNTLYYEGSASAVFRNSAIGMGTGAATAAVSFYAGPIVGGAFGGALYAAIGGRNVGRAAAAGAIAGAITAAVSYGAYQAYGAYSDATDVAARNGTGNQFDVKNVADLTQTQDAMTLKTGWEDFRAFHPELRNADPTGAKIQGGDIVNLDDPDANIAGLFQAPNVITINRALPLLSRGGVITYGHEMTHLGQYYSGAEYSEVEAERFGRAFYEFMSERGFQ